MLQRAHEGPAPVRLTLCVLALAAAALASGGRASGDAAGTWSPVTLPLAAPLPRAGHTLATYNGDAILFGGASPNPTAPGEIALTDLWIYRAKAAAFARLNSTTPVPPGRYLHASTVQGIRLYSFMGRGQDGGLLGDVWYYDFPRICWEPIRSQSAAQPVARAEHSAVTQDADVILMFGGRGDAGLLDDLWSFLPFTAQWVQRASFPAGGRSGHVAGFLGGRMYVLGGTSAAGVQSDVWAYNPQGNAWSALTSDGDVPGPFTGSAGAVGDFERTGSPQIMVTGGVDGAGTPLADAYTVTIDPSGQVAHWKRQTAHDAGLNAATTPVAPPTGPASAANLLLFGGRQGGQPTNAAWLFSNAGSAPSGPDLTVAWTGVTAKSKGKGTKLRWTLTGSVRVTNGGTATAGANALQVVLSVDGGVHTGDPVLKLVKLKALAPGRTVTLKWSTTLPAGLTPSGQFVVAVVDAAGQVVETSESNNTAVSGPLP